MFWQLWNWENNGMEKIGFVTPIPLIYELTHHAREYSSNLRGISPADIVRTIYNFQMFPLAIGDFGYRFYQLVFRVRRNGCHFKTTYSVDFPWLPILMYSPTITQHSFWWWFGVDKVPGTLLDQWRHVVLLVPQMNKNSSMSTAFTTSSENLTAC